MNYIPVVFMALSTSLSVTKIHLLFPAQDVSTVLQTLPLSHIPVTNR